MPETSLPGITIIIPVYNGGKAFAACLESLKALDPQPYEVIVVGDGDTDGSAGRARQAGFTVVDSPQRQGPAGARNLGARAAGGNIFFFLDADVSPSSDAVGRVAEIFARNAEISACFGSYDDEPTDPGFVSQYRNLLHHYIHQTASADASTFWTGCGAVRREVFLALNGFNIRYRRPALEDIELGYRLKKQDHRILLDKCLLVKHHKKWTIFSVLKTDIFDRALPWTRLILDGRRPTDDLNLKIESRISVVMVFLLLVSLLLTLFSALFWVPIALALLSLLGLNRDLYRFFFRKRGLGFAGGAVVLHWLYYLCCGLGFGIGLGEFMLHKIRNRR